MRESPIRLYDDKDEAETQCGILRLLLGEHVSLEIVEEHDVNNGVLWMIAAVSRHRPGSSPVSYYREDGEIR